MFIEDQTVPIGRSHGLKANEPAYPADNLDW